jgi:hypothetical protein
VRVRVSRVGLNWGMGETGLRRGLEFGLTMDLELSKYQV